MKGYSTQWFIAWRYVWAKKSMGTVHIIMWSSIVSVTVGVACLFIILGIYNGMAESTYQQFGQACPDLLVKNKEGLAYFDWDVEQEQPFFASSTPHHTSQVLEQEVLMTYKNKKILVRLVGVDTVFHSVLQLANYTTKKQWEVGTLERPYLIISTRAANQLLIDPDDTQEPLLLSAVAMDAPKSASLISNLRSEYVPSFTTYYEIGNDLRGIPVVYTNLDFLRYLLNAPVQRLSSLYIGLDDKPTDVSSVKAQWKQQHPQFQFLDRYEQNETYFSIFSAEKKMLLLVIFFMLTVAMTGSIGALRILFLEKINFSKILYSMGQSFSSIRQIFFYQSLIINIAGLVGGLCIGGLFLLSQYWFGWLKVQSMTYSMPYEIDIAMSDVAMVVGSVFLLNLLGIGLAMRGIKQRVMQGIVDRF